MGLLNTGTLFIIITLTVLLNSIELSSQALQIEPPGYPHPRPPSYVIENGVVRLTGESAGGEAVVIDGYFLGTWEHNNFRPVDPFDENIILNVQTRRFETKSEEFVSRLRLYHAIASGRINVNNRRRRPAAGH